jgi:choline dehydrogenase-like flavoprotein
MDSFSPLFPIVIPTYNQPDLLASCLQSLAQLSYPRDRFEVIVFDNDSSPPIVPVAESLAIHPPCPDTMTNAAHQMGTTRIASHPSGGVVDTNCRVFGTENLYVASSAVFPTGPSYSPTFTILALARRLGQHLLQTVPQSVKSGSVSTVAAGKPHNPVASPAALENALS